jgi:hypothetical protein
MTPFCATLMTLACLGQGPDLSDGPMGLSHSVAGRLGVVYERDGSGQSRTVPMAELGYAMTLRHQLDSGVRIVLSVGFDASTLRRPAGN